jgi:uncharacterized protein (TIGR00725 family)
MRKAVVAVMGGSEREGLSESEKARLRGVAEALGTALAQHSCVLITGATTGLPDLVCRAFRDHGGFALGVSPASSGGEHVKLYALPEDAADVIVYTGFGLKGRNVISVRSADIVLIFGGATGTLNEFTIAYDEGKIIGILEGSGGVADHVREIIDFCKKPTRGVVLFDQDPHKLAQRCLDALNKGTAAAP